MIGRTLSLVLLHVISVAPTGGSDMPAKRARIQKHTHYHKDGTVWAKGPLVDGVMTGYWEWYRKDGSIMRSGYFENGEQVGEWTTYDKNGEVVRVTTIKPKQAKKAK